MWTAGWSREARMHPEAEKVKRAARQRENRYLAVAVAVWSALAIIIYLW